MSWQPYGDLPVILASTNGAYAHAPDWYRNFCYVRERERGLDFSEDLATPGVFTFDLADGEAVMILRAGRKPIRRPAPAVQRAEDACATSNIQRRTAFAFAPASRSADAYVVARDEGRTILAGFPWFTDWGRDTFIAMRGLLLAWAAYEAAEAILLEWASTLSEGMLPNRFPD